MATRIKRNNTGTMPMLKYVRTQYIEFKGFFCRQIGLWSLSFGSRQSTLSTVKKFYRQQIRTLELDFALLYLFILCFDVFTL